MKEDDLQTIYNNVFQEALMLTMNHDPQKIAQLIWQSLVEFIKRF